MTSHESQELASECCRCGYDLRGIADDRACPECGLLAERSRRATDELHDTRPKWLASISWGVNLILFAILLACSWMPLSQSIAQWLNNTIWQNLRPRRFINWEMPVEFAGLIIAGILLARGVFLLTRREGYEPADFADRRRRIALRAAAFVPLAALALAYINYVGSIPPWGFTFGIRRNNALLEWMILLLFTLGVVPLVLLLFFQLRAIAKRARSAHLAEHCAIVAYGTAATTLYIGVAAHNDWFENFVRSSAPGPMLWMLSACLFSSLFILWSLYLLVRFAISFRNAANMMRTKWTRDDRAVESK